MSGIGVDQMTALITAARLHPKMSRANAERVITAALAIEGTREFRSKHQPCLNGEIHPYAVIFARVVLAATTG